MSRADYDRQLSASDVASQPGTPSPAAPPSPPGSPAPAPPEPDPVPRGGWFSEERARGDAFVRKAALNRLRHALAATMGAEAEQPAVRGFDVAVVPKPKLFSRTRGPRLLVRFVARVDAAAIADAWKEALKWNVPGPQEICVLLMGSDIAPARELADAIGEQRRKPVRTAKVTLVPVDTRDWHAHLPTDAPALVRALLDRLHDQAR